MKKQSIVNMRYAVSVILYFFSGGRIMKQKKLFLQFSVTLLLGLLLGTLNLQAAPIGIFDSMSLNMTEIIGSQSDGNLFSFDFGLSSLNSSTSSQFVTGAYSFGYLNVMAGSTWLIQDEPIPLIDDLKSELNHFWFSSALSDFTGATAIFNDTAFGILPTVDGSWSTIGAGGTIDWGSEDPAGGANEGDPGAGTPPPAVTIIEGYLRGGVPDIEQLHNECGPTSVTNSLLWLIKKYRLPTDKLPKKADGELDEPEILKQLAKAIKPGWDDTQSVVNGNRCYSAVTSTDIIAGKKKFAKDNMLPLEMHGGWNDPNAKGAKTFDFIKKELKKGQDVELSVLWDGGGAHWVTVVGYIDAGQDKKTLVVHDPDDKSDGNVYWKLKDDGAFTSFGGSTQVAVAESPIPEPSTLLLVAVGGTVLLVYSRRTTKKGGANRIRFG